MGTTRDDIAITSVWSELTDTDSGLVSIDARLQNVGSGAVAIVEGGASAPADKSGTILRPGDSVEVNNANLWASSIDSTGIIGVTAL